MKTNVVLALMKRLEPFLKKYLGETLYRLHAKNSPYFQPIINAGALLAVLSAFLVAIKDTLIDAGLPLPGWFTIVVAMVGSASGAIALVASLTIDNSEAKQLAKS